MGIAILSGVALQGIAASDVGNEVGTLGDMKIVEIQLLAVGLLARRNTAGGTTAAAALRA